METRNTRDSAPFFHFKVMSIALVIWGFYLYSLHPGKFVFFDELDYISLALNFSEHFSLETKVYFFGSLLDQSPPLRGSHNPGFQMLLGSFLKLTGINSSNVIAREKSILLYNFVLFFPLLVTIYQFTKSKFGGQKLALASSLLLLTFPIIALLSQAAMAETTVVATTFMLFFVMFEVMPKRHFGCFLLVAILFWCCFLIRQNIVFLLPVYLLSLYRREGARRAGWFLLCLAALYPVVYVLALNRMVYPDSFMSSQLFKAESISEAVSLLAQNFWKNVQLIGSFFPKHYPDSMYGITKIACTGLTVMALLSYPLLSHVQRRYYRVIMAFFLLNTICLFLFYDNYDWRGLRVSIQFVPFFIVLVLGAAARSLRGNRIFMKKLYCALTLILFLYSAISTEFVLRLKEKRLIRLNTAANVMETLLGENLSQERKYVVLSNGIVHRGYLLFPKTHYVHYSHSIVPPAREFDVVDRKLHFDLIVIAPGTSVLPYLSSRGFYRLPDFSGYHLFARRERFGNRGAGVTRLNITPHLIN